MKKRADGRYCKQILVGYRPDGQRKVKTIYGKTIKEVEKKERELRIEIDIGISFDGECVTVGEWADEWLETFKTGIAHNTYQRYQGIIKKYIKPLMGELRLKDVRLNFVQHTINKLNKNLAPASVKKYKDTLHQMFEQAIRVGYVHINPINGVELPKHRQIDRCPLADSEILDICEFCKTSSQGALIMTLLYTGIRRGELLALTKADVDIDKKIISINKAVEFINGTPNVKVPKTPKSIRIIPILNPLLPYLKEVTRGKKEEELLFCNAQGEPFNVSAIGRYYKRFLEEYNQYLSHKYEDRHEKAQFTMHQFRHTFCTMLYKAGVDVKTAQEILGHSSINVTLGIYTHIDEKVKDINTQKIDAYIQNLELSQSKVSQA